MKNKNGSGNILIPILVILLVVVFMIPITGMLLNDTTVEPLNTPLYDLNNHTLNEVFSSGAETLPSLIENNDYLLYTDNLTSKNLFDIDKLLTTDSYLTIEKTSETEFTLTGVIGTGIDTINYIPAIQFKTNTQYTFSGNTYQDGTTKDTRFRIKYTDGTTDNFPIPTTSLSNFSITSDSAKTIEMITYAYVSSGGTTYYTNFQIEEGTTVTVYEPYHDYGIVNPIIETLTGNSNIGFKLDTTILGVPDTSIENEVYEDGNTWKLKEYAKLDTTVVKTATSWGISYIKTITHAFYKDLTGTLDYKVPIDAGNIANIYLKIGNTVYKVVSDNYVFANDEEDIISIATANSIRIRVNKTTYSDSSAFETYLQANDVSFYYELNTMVETSVDKYFFDLDNDLYVNLTTLGITSLTIEQVNYYYTLYKYYNSL